MEQLEMQFINVGDVTLHVVMAGPEDGTPIILLHGFPEFWYGWNKQIPVLAANGYRVIVPDQRGYNLSDKPRGKENYTLSLLAQDIAGLIDALGYEQVHLVGHDWGGVVSWIVAMNYPQMLTKMVVMNAPHPAAMIGEFMRGNLTQILKSSYIGFFNIPFLPETLLSLNDYEGFAKALQSNATRGAFSDDEMENYRRAWSQPDAMTSMLNYYRAVSSPQQSNALRKKRVISVPTLMLWGEQDVALGKEMARPSMDLVEDGELVFFPKATHWIQHDEPESVNEELLAFLAEPTPVAE